MKNDSRLSSSGSVAGTVAHGCNDREWGSPILGHTDPQCFAEIDRLSQADPTRFRFVHAIQELVR